MPVEITMPQLSDTMTEGTVVKWLKKEGDKVTSGDIIADIETDKAVMEQEISDTGTLAAILVAEGEKVPVGSVLGLLATGKEDAAEIKQQSRSASPAAATPAKPATVVREISSSRAQGATATIEKASSGEIHERSDIGHGATRQPPTAVPPIPGRDGNGENRLRVSPLARRVAAEKKIDLQAVTGSGPGGRIVAQDILNFTPPAIAPDKSILAAIEQIPAGEKKIIPVTKIRAAIAKALVASKQNVPHFYETIDVDVEDLSRLRGKLNESLEAEKIRLSLGDLIARGVIVALQRHPALNATFNGTEITRYGDVHLGMAVSIPDGLIVPVLRNIHQLSLKEIRQRTVDLVDRARGQRLKQEEMTGATFTVSNLGTYGIKDFSAIINPPQVAILAIAAAEKRAVVRDDQIVARTMMSLTLSADHRIVDGATAADFLRTLKNLLEEPALMFI